MRRRTDCRGGRAVRALTEPGRRKREAKQGDDERDRCNQESAARRLGEIRRHGFVLQSWIDRHGDPRACEASFVRRGSTSP